MATPVQTLAVSGPYDISSLSCYLASRNNSSTRAASIASNSLPRLGEEMVLDGAHAEFLLAHQIARASHSDMPQEKWPIFDGRTEQRIVSENANKTRFGAGNWQVFGRSAENVAAKVAATVVPC
jgi:hypothetical protein